MKELIIKSERRKTTGKLFTSFRRETNSVLRLSDTKAFAFNKESLFISETNTRGKDKLFSIHMKLDGHKENEGQSILSQMRLTKDELTSLRDEISYILYDLDR